MDNRPITGDHVKIIFHNGMVEEGIVLEWNDSGKSYLKAPASDNLLVIQNTAYVLAVQVEQGSSAKLNKVAIDVELEPIKHESREDLRAASLVELHKLRIAEERTRAREHLTTFKNTGTVQVQYGLPRNLPKSVLFDPTKENRGCDRGHQKCSSDQIRGAFPRR